MARYRVPKFIEKDPKIIGPMTFKQFVYIGVAGLVSAILYFVIESLFLFIFIAVFLFLIAIALAFITIGGKSLPEIILHSVTYLFSSKIYLWEKKQSTPKVIKQKKQGPQKKKTDQSPLKMTEKSRLKEMETKVKTGKK